jgi:hypothetical protein
MAMKICKGVVAALWESYSSLVLPQDCPDIQRLETERAFYSGLMAAVVLLPECETDEEVGIVKGEIEEFFSCDYLVECDESQGTTIN